MKKYLPFLIVLSFLAANAVFAAKPAGNNAGVVQYDWHASADVLPAPPYGSADIPGATQASKLIVNQPNGKIIANMTGVMNGLLPNTEYAVYVSKVYTPYVFTGWNL